MRLRDELWFQGRNGFRTEHVQCPRMMP
jgi:hypothetical protein